ncbi:MAG: NmrA family NAD(P)-binding protein [Armatimonadota bacterium]|nr:NmrA family NAD(P)-binding protein [Armatimonadota bacterium]
MILVTGAGGKTGRAVIRALVRRRAEVRAFVRRPDQVGLLRPLGVREVVVGDLLSPHDVPWAMRGAAAVYHICPNVSPDEVTIGRLAIRAARRMGVARFVYHSVLQPHSRALPHHRLKGRVERLLLRAGVPSVILRPASYMQNVLAGWDRIVRERVYAVPYALSTRLGLVDLDDIAEVAAMALTEDGHLGRVYDLAAGEVLDQREIAAVLSRVLGRSVQPQVIPRDVWEQRARAAGLGDYQVTTLRAMFRYYERRGFWGDPSVLTMLLGRPPTTFAAFVERVALGRI